MSTAGVSTYPRPTVGHHFGALLQCAHRAWCDYHAEVIRKMDPPAYLIALQNEGFQHERDVCEDRYASAVRIPERGDPDERYRRTLAAMRRGEPAILQAYLRDGEGVGIADVLELVDRTPGSRLGHRYRVGEFKRATSLQTAHVLQATWYNEILGKMQGGEAAEFFFVLGDMRRETVAVTEINGVYRECKIHLAALRKTTVGPGPHLCRGCLSCPWRGICVPDIAQSEHVSLIPGISRAQARRLREQGIGSWRQLAQTLQSEAIGRLFSRQQITRIDKAMDALHAGRAVTRFELRASVFNGLAPISFAYLEGIEHRDRPTALWHESVEGPAVLPLAYAADGHCTTMIAPLQGVQGVAVYGGRDAAVVSRIWSGRLQDMPRCVDLLAVVEGTIHAPLLGLELKDVASFAGAGTLHAGDVGSRVNALRGVLNWITDGTEAVA